jgi:MFS superfamily sulfate permease-like transporter
LGIDPKFLKGKEPLELLMMIPDSIIHENAHIAEIGIACILILIGMSFVKHNKLKKIPAPLIVLAVAIPIGMTLHIKTDGQIAAFSLVKIGSVFDSFKNGLINANFSGIYSNVGLFIQYVILFSLIGTLESLLTAKAIDGLDPFKRKSNFNKDVIAVGIGNVISGLLGGLPMISEVARSSANVANGARTRWANFFHGLFLLIAILFAVPFIELIPNSALAAMLTFVGFKLAHPKEFIHMWHIGKEQFLIFTATVITTLATDLLIGVGTGILLEIIVNIYNGCSLKMLFSSNLTLTNQDEDNYRLTINSGLVFSNILGFKKVFLTIPSGKNIIIDMTKAKIVDHTSIITLNSLIHDYKHTHGKINLIGFENHRQLSHAPTSTRILKRN